MLHPDFATLPVVRLALRMKYDVVESVIIAAYQASVKYANQRMSMRLGNTRYSA